jgi:serine/threonine-protein kinase
VEALAALDAVPGAHDWMLGSDPAEPVEVFDHVPPLPAGWGEHGPDGSPFTKASEPGSVTDQGVPTTRATRVPATTTRGRVPPLARVLAVVGLLLIVAAIVVATAGS